VTAGVIFCEFSEIDRSANWGTTPSSQRKCSVGTSGEELNKMRQFGKVDIPQEAFIAALKVDS
jgi:translation elongation factor EF-4